MLEIWPLVIEYGWNYDSIKCAANMKPGFKIDFFLTPETIEERCKAYLDLRLSPQGQNRKGRQRRKDATGDIILPPLCDVALAINGIGAGLEQWLQGGQSNSV